MVIFGFYAAIIFMMVEDIKILKKFNAKKDITVYVVFMLIAAAAAAAWFLIPGHWGLADLLKGKL